MKRRETQGYLYEQIVRDIEGQIGEGVLRVGERLPSIRRLCAQERVSPASVLHAFSILESRGLIQARPKSGYFVRHRRLDTADRPVTSSKLDEPVDVGIADIAVQVFKQASDHDKVPLGAGVPASALLPLERLSRCAARVAREKAGLFGAYDPVAGHPELIRQLALRFRILGCTIPSDEIVTTGGAMDALNLALRATTRRGDIVAVELPGYFGILEILESLGLKALPIPSTCEQGIDLELLAEAIEQHPVKAVALVPTFSNPNGSCLSEEKRVRLLTLLRDHDLPLIEDDLYGDLHFGPERVRPVKAFDDDGRVLYCGSFSKSLSPGLRVGWLAAGRYVDAVKRLKCINTLATPALNQATIAQFLSSGAMDRHLRGLRAALFTQVTQVAELVMEFFPPGTALSQPGGGLFLWVELPSGVESLAVFHEASRNGIHLVPGEIFCPKASLKNHIRLSCGHPCDDRIKQGIKQLGRIVRGLQRRNVRTT